MRAELTRWAAFALGHAEPALRAACRHRHEPARLCFARRARAAVAAARRRRRSADEPFRLVGGARRSAQRDADRAPSQRRARRFRRWRLRSPIPRACFCRSGRIFDLVRPGYALYGGNPTPGAANPMRPVVTLEIAIQQTRWIEDGRDLRLQRPLDRQAPHAACDPARRLRRRPAAHRRRRSTPRRARKS